MNEVSQLTIHRLTLYRKILKELKEQGIENVFSYKLATLAGRSPAQVRRDLMEVGYFGTPVHGYKIDELKKSLDEYLDTVDGQEAALVGLGNLGRAILDYCNGLNPKLKISAAFDRNDNKVGKVFSGCPCYHISQLEEVIKEKHIEIVILAIQLEGAQSIAERCAQSGVRAFLNYTPARLALPDEIYVENRDMMLALEKAAFFARNNHRKGKNE
jgi:redox-sensing transcriptional repressor